MLDRAQVLHVARLARLELDDAEVERMAAELSKVLDHIEKIRELDLHGVPPTSHVVDVAGVVRADEPRPCYSAEVAVASAPEPVEVEVAGLTEPGLGFGVPSPGQAPGE
jgi:aspartyl-tRNA(Asn)/glutamyl-tRNA(Gln) amidotransferase subunit C